MQMQQERRIQQYHQVNSKNHDNTILDEEEHLGLLAVSNENLLCIMQLNTKNCWKEPLEIYKLEISY